MVYAGEYRIIPDLSGLPANRRHSKQGRTTRGQSREVARRKQNKEAQQQDEERQSRRYQRNQISEEEQQGEGFAAKKKAEEGQAASPDRLPESSGGREDATGESPFLLSRPASAGVTTSD